MSMTSQNYLIVSVLSVIRVDVRYSLTCPSQKNNTINWIIPKFVCMCLNLKFRYIDPASSKVSISHFHYDSFHILLVVLVRQHATPGLVVWLALMTLESDTSADVLSLFVTFFCFLFVLV